MVMVMATVKMRRRTHEKIIGIRIWTANLEQLHEVVELAVDIAAHGHGAFLPRLAEDMCFSRRCVIPPAGHLILPAGPRVPEGD